MPNLLETTLSGLLALLAKAREWLGLLVALRKQRGC